MSESTRSKDITILRKPRWFKKHLEAGPAYEKIRSMIRDNGLHTVCQEAQCPNLWHCFSKKTATFLIMGNRCTRACRFCAVDHGPPDPPDRDEPTRVAEAVTKMGLRYVVVTSVTRDDLSDGGASHFSKTIDAIKNAVPHAQIEVLIPDFQGKHDALTPVLKAGPAVLNHNIETVPRLYHEVRPGADYERSLNLMKAARDISPDIPVKSGLMLGLGERASEVIKTMQDLREAGCTILTLGQYLQPSLVHLPVKRFVPPDEFERWGEEALSLGFAAVASGPFVRSSYNAANLFLSATRAVEKRSY